MMLKKLVAGFLISSLSALTLILVVGLFVPVTFFARFTQPDTPVVETVAVDENGNKIEDATVIKQKDGSTVVVDVDGKVIDNAGTATAVVGGNDSASPPSTGGGSGTNTGPSSDPGPQPDIPPKPKPGPTPEPDNPPDPPPPPKLACGSGGACTTAQVAAHNSQSNCWVIYNGKVYNVTQFVSRHEGGRDVFNSNTCGHDIGQYLHGTREPVSGERHSHSSSDISDINPYYIADLAG